MEMNWRGMTFGQFNDMMAKREATQLAAGDEECLHPFDVTGMQWHTRRTPGHYMIAIDYVCPNCGEHVARSNRDIKVTQ